MWCKQPCHLILVNCLPSRYCSNWKIIAAKSFILYIVGKFSVLGSQKLSHFLHRVKWPDTIGHNAIGILHLVWALFSEPMKIKSRFFLLVMQVMTWESYFKRNQLSLGMKICIAEVLWMKPILVYFFNNLLFLDCWKFC